MSNDEFDFNIDRIRSPFSKAQIIASLEKYAQLHNVDTFGMREYDAWSRKLAHSETIRVRFGTWGKALQAAGCRAERGGKLDPKTMVKAFRDCWREHKSVPSYLPGRCSRPVQRVLLNQNGPTLDGVVLSRVLCLAGAYKKSAQTPSRHPC